MTYRALPHLALLIAIFLALPLALLTATSAALHADESPGTSLDTGLDPAALIAELEAPVLDIEHPRALQDVRLTTGFASFDLHDGLLFPVTTASGRVIEMVFIGHGRVEARPPDEIEAGQLEIFTGERELGESFGEAVFAVSRDQTLKHLLERPTTTADADTARRAKGRFEAWRDSPERQLLAVDAGLLNDALGVPLYEDFFVAWMAGRELGDFLLVNDPAAEEALNIGQFVPVDATTREKRRISRLLSREQRQGRFRGFDVDDLGVWDTWLSAARTAPGDGLGGTGFEPRHYTLDVTLDPRSGGLEGHAAIELVARTDGRRTVELELHRDLAVKSVRHLGRKLEVLRRGSEVHVVLLHTPPEGAQLTLEVYYGGTFLDRGNEGNWALRDGLGWYPHAGEIDRATYDVTLRRPKNIDLLAAGTWVASGENDGLRFERRRLDMPSIGFGFEIGRFKVNKVRVGDVSLTVAFDPALLAVSGGSDDDLAEITRAVADSLAFYESLFGDYPLDELIVVTVPREYSQAMLGFVTLSNAMMIDWGVFGGLLGFTDRRAVVAHEVAHQWWGHVIGWESYRDQWISEAMANYAALLFSRQRLGHLGHTGPTAGWQQELTALADDGRPVEALGPLVLGQRLASSRSTNAYEAVVYRKGAVVLGMLARLVGGEEPFLRALRWIVRHRAGEVLATDDFLTLLADHTATELDAFAGRFIYGTGLPEVYYSYDIEPAEGERWRVRLRARRSSHHGFAYEVVERENGAGLDVSRRPLAEAETVDSPLLVPFEVALADSFLGLRGELRLRGVESEVAFETEGRPREIILDGEREVFGRFFDERRHAKRLLLSESYDSAAQGHFQDAEELLQAALTARSAKPAGPRELRQLQDLAERLLDARIHLELARLRLDHGHEAAAQRSLEAAEEQLGRPEQILIDQELTLLEARLDLHAGDTSRAFKKLRREVLKKRRLTTAEGYLLLAIAARELDEKEIFERAVEGARRKGADVSRLLSP